MRVLAVGSLYPPHHFGGYELIWRSAMRHLVANGHEVDVLTTTHRVAEPDPTWPEDPGVHRELRWYWSDHEFPRLGPWERLQLERRNLDVLDRHLARLDPDVVSWWAMGGMSLSLIERVSRRHLPAVGVVGDEWMLYGPRADAWQRAVGGRGSLTVAIERFTGVHSRLDLGAAARWLFISDGLRRRSLQRWDLPRSAVVRVGPDPALFPRAPEKPWGGRLLYVGRIDSRKGIATAIRALASLPEMTLTVDGAGDERHRAELEDLAHGAGLNGRLDFRRSPREELARVYAEADAVLFPVLWEEPWGLVPLEAMAVGTPVVATSGGGDYLRDGENCLLFDPRDDHLALAGAVRTLASDGALRTRLRESGFATAARFDEASFNDAVARAHEEAAA